MLHRKTYDTLSDIGTVLHWEVSTIGGLIAVQEKELSAITIWHESWQESLEPIATYDLKVSGSLVTPANFGEAQEFGKALVASVASQYT